jgi:hypothetical protein
MPSGSSRVRRTARRMHRCESRVDRIHVRSLIRIHAVAAEADQLRQPGDVVARREVRHVDPQIAASGVGESHHQLPRHSGLPVAVGAWRVEDYHLGTCSRDDTRAYLRDLDRFRGRSRLWVFYRSGPAIAFRETRCAATATRIDPRVMAVGLPFWRLRISSTHIYSG